MIETPFPQMVIDRLNELIRDPNVRKDIASLIEARVECNEPTAEETHVIYSDGKLGFLGLLNGILGVIPDGPYKGWGQVMAVFDEDSGSLIRFQHTTNHVPRVDSVEPLIESP